MGTHSGMFAVAVVVLQEDVRAFTSGYRLCASNSKGKDLLHSCFSAFATVTHFFPLWFPFPPSGPLSLRL